MCFLKGESLKKGQDLIEFFKNPLCLRVHIICNCTYMCNVSVSLAALWMFFCQKGCEAGIK